MTRRRVDGLSIKAGPTESGGPTPTPPPAIPVGGEVVDVNVISVFLSQYWPLIVVMLIPLAFALYAKRNALPKWFLRLMYRIKG